MGKRELETLDEELLEVGAADVLGLLDLNDLEDLRPVNTMFQRSREIETCLDIPETRTVAGSHVLVEGIDGLGPGHLTVLLVHVVGTGARVVTDPDTEVLDLLGALLVDLSESAMRFEILLDCVITWFTDTISPLAFLILRSLPRKYQNRDLATTSLGAKMRMRKSFGVGLASLGRWRPMIWYS